MEHSWLQLEKKERLREKEKQRKKQAAERKKTEKAEAAERVQKEVAAAAASAAAESKQYIPPPFTHPAKHHFLCHRIAIYIQQLLIQYHCNCFKAGKAVCEDTLS